MLQDLILPLATLLGLADKPGEGHGLGTLDPDLCRTLAATATLSPHTTICLTITNPDGIAIGHGCAKPGGPPPRPRPPGGPAPPLVALPARINLTITADRLAELLSAGSAARRTRTASRPGAGRLGARPARHPRIPARPRARRATRTGAAPGTLTLPDGRELTARLEPVPTYECDHRHESHAYQPNDKLRHLVQVRDHTCTFPPCSRHAQGQRL